MRHGHLRRRASVVKTGARANRLLSELERIGLARSQAAPPLPRLLNLPEPARVDILSLYAQLGGAQREPSLRPGSWDLVFEGLVVELDEELHFNRYRAATLVPEWTNGLPWRDAYRTLCAQREPECLKAAQWGKRWTNPSTEAQFGPPAEPGDLDGGGAPRWKQRAFYDAMKDAAAAAGSFSLARLSVYDDLDGVPLGTYLTGSPSAMPPEPLAVLVAERRT